MSSLGSYPQPSTTGDIEEIYTDVLYVLQPKMNADLVEFGIEQYPSWNPETVHMLHMPMRDLTERRYKSVIFVGAARTGKTMSLVTLFLAYTVLADPVDFALFMPTEQLASYYSKKRWGVELLMEMPQIRDQIRAGSGNETVYTKILKSGAIVNFGWNSVSQVASKDFVRVVLSDIDRTGSTGAEGDFFSLAAKRTTTAMSRGMVLAESSPAKPISDPEYLPSSNHEAPPTFGILGLYNSGDRKILYSQCPHCEDYFAPTPDMTAFHLDPELSKAEQASKAFLICTTCGGELHHDYEKDFKRKATWVGDGQEIDSDGVVHGDLLPTTSSSYWMTGFFSAFVSWEQMIIEYLDAKAEYDLTGNEERLKSFHNITLGTAYLEHARRVDTSQVGVLMARAEQIDQYIVPPTARVLLASVDIQGGRNARFVVSVMAYGENGERWCIDRYSITQRDDGTRVMPHSNEDDWDYVTLKVVNSTYRIDGDRELRVYRTAVDTGGAAGATERCYAWYRRLKQQGLSKRVLLVKGGSYTTENSLATPIVKQSYPDATNKADKYVGARGDVPILLLNTILLKDAVKSSIDREDMGANYFHFSDWQNEPFFKELVAETRTAKGWILVGSRNEQFDLCVYSHAAWLWLKGHKVNWDIPPSWCAPFDLNSEMMTKSQRQDMKEKPLKKVRRSNRFRFNS